jgi:hypothetical protein
MAVSHIVTLNCHLLKCTLMLRSELTLRLGIGYLEHIHDSQPQCNPRLPSLEVHASKGNISGAHGTLVYMVHILNLIH